MEIIGHMKDIKITVSVLGLNGHHDCSLRRNEMAGSVFSQTPAMQALACHMTSMFIVYTQ